MKSSSIIWAKNLSETSESQAYTSLEEYFFHRPLVNGKLIEVFHTEHKATKTRADSIWSFLHEGDNLCDREILLFLPSLSKQKKIPTTSTVPALQDF